jgi:hypothetical protein
MNVSETFGMVMGAILLMACCGCSKDRTTARPRRDVPVPSEVAVTAPIASDSRPSRPTPVRPREDDGMEYALTFAWPEEVRAKVVSTRRQATTAAALISDASWTFSKKGNLIRLETLDLGQLPAGSELDNLRRSFVVSYAWSNFRIDAKGDFVALVDAEKARQLLRASTLAALPRGMNMATADRIYDQAFSDEVMSRAAATSWSSLVSGWRREKMVSGRPQKIVNEVPLPMLGISVKFDNVLLLVNKVPCVTEVPPRCVWLEGIATPERAAMAAAYADMREKNIVDAPALAALDISYRTEIVLEPDTLLPHWHRQTKVTSASFDGDRAAAHTETEERSDWFEYDPSAASGSGGQR